jgi:hypothetical protein
VASVVAVLLVVSIPTLVGGALVGVGKLWRYMAERPRRQQVLPMGPPIERIAADLRRLHGQRHELRNQAPAPGRWIRAQALDWAYTDVLTVACRALDVSPPQVSRSGAALATEIRRAEHQLRECGLDVRSGRIG